jgi:hypothetical protein
LPPEVIAWSLLFVIVFSVVYRFFAWIGRRLGAKRSRRTVTAELEVASRAPPVYRSVPVGSAAPAPAPVQALSQAPAPAVQSPPPLPLASAEADEVLPSEPSDGAEPAAHVPRDGGASEEMTVDAEPPSPLVAGSRTPDAPIAVPSGPIATEVVRTALAPSVAATMPPRPPMPPSIGATLPPAAASEDLREIESGEPTEAIAPEPARDDTPLSVDEPRPAKTVRLRARRIGAKAVSLDRRLRNSRERRIRRIPRTTRKPGPPGAKTGLRVLVAKAPSKKPMRRIAKKADAVIVFASTKAQRKIMIASQRRFRVLSVPVVRD